MLLITFLCLQFLFRYRNKAECIIVKRWVLSSPSSCLSSKFSGKAFHNKTDQLTSTGLCFFSNVPCSAAVLPQYERIREFCAPNLPGKVLMGGKWLVLLLEWHLLQVTILRIKGLWLYKRKEYFSIILEQPVLLHLLIWILLFVGEMGN